VPSRSGGGATVMNLPMTTMLDVLMDRSVELVLAAVPVGLASYLLINRLTFRGDLLAVASAATRKFYSQADELFTESNLPDDLKSVLYDVVLAVTKDDIGRLVCQDIMKADDRPHKDSGLEASLRTLIRDHPGIASRFLDAVRLGMTSILYSHAYSMRRAAITIAKTTNDQSGLVRAAEALERKLGEIIPTAEPASAIA
jgi:hypothetical protein